MKKYKHNKNTNGSTNYYSQNCNPFELFIYRNAERKKNGQKNKKSSAQIALGENVTEGEGRRGRETEKENWCQF